MALEVSMCHPIRIFVCEDEQTEQTKLAEVLRHSPIPSAATYFSTGEALLDSYYPGCCDLVLMDIFLEGLNGVETASRLRSNDPEIPIAFLTTSPDFTMEGFRNRVDRYLLKPIQPEELFEALRLAQKKAQRQSTLSLIVHNKSQLVPVYEICFAEQQAHTVYVHLTNGLALKVRCKISQLAEQLPSPPFYQFHKSYIVNLSQVRYLDNQLKAFVMDGGYAYIRRESLKSAREIYSQFMFNQVRSKEES